jgi:23S rRNA A2030 N6-methylase RlmJ
METTVLRDELHAYLDALPDRSLPALRPLLSFLIEPPYTIETDMSDEENAMIEESLAEYRADPSSLTPWRKVRRG